MTDRSSDASRPAGTYKELLQAIRWREPAGSESASRAEAEALNVRITDLVGPMSQRERLDLKGVDLAGANLTGLNLWKANLEGATLAGADARANIGHANLRGANLTGARLSNLAHSDLTGANLEEAQLQKAVLLGAKLDHANLQGADLRGADLRSASLEDVRWSGARFDPTTRFPLAFGIPAAMVWEGQGANPRTTRPVRAVTGSESLKTLGVDCLLSDAELAEVMQDVDWGTVFPDGPDPEMLQHLLYGPDLACSMVLEYCQDRFDLSAEVLQLNLWYRCERFVRLLDAVEGGYSDGDHARADRLLEIGALDGVPEDEFAKIFKQLDCEVEAILA